LINAANVRVIQFYDRIQIYGQALNPLNLLSTSKNPPHPYIVPATKKVLQIAANIFTNDSLGSRSLKRCH